MKTRIRRSFELTSAISKHTHFRFFIILIISLLTFGLANACQMWGAVCSSYFEDDIVRSTLFNSTVDPTTSRTTFTLFDMATNGHSNGDPYCDDGWGYVHYGPYGSNQTRVNLHRSETISSDQNGELASYIGAITNPSNSVRTTIVHARAATGATGIDSPHPFLFAQNNHLFALEQNGTVWGTGNQTAATNDIHALLRPGFIALKSFQNLRYTRFNYNYPGDHLLVDSEYYGAYFLRNLMVANTYIAGDDATKVDWAINQTTPYSVSSPYGGGLTNVMYTRSGSSLNAIITDGDQRLWAVKNVQGAHTDWHNLFYDGDGSYYIAMKYGDNVDAYTANTNFPTAFTAVANGHKVYLHADATTYPPPVDNALTTQATENSLRTILVEEYLRDHDNIDHEYYRDWDTSSPAIASGWNGLFASTFVANVSGYHQVQVRWFNQMGMLEQKSIPVSDTYTSSMGSWAKSPDLAFQTRPETQYPFPSPPFITQVMRRPNFRVIWEAHTPQHPNMILSRSFHFNSDTLVNNFQTSNIDTIADYTGAQAPEVSSPKIAVDDLSNYAVCWIEYDGTNSVVKIRSLTYGETPLAITPANAFCINPNITFVGTFTDIGDVYKRFAVSFEKETANGRNVEVVFVDFIYNSVNYLISNPAALWTEVIRTGLEDDYEAKPAIANCATTNTTNEGVVVVCYGVANSGGNCSIEAKRIPVAFNGVGTVTSGTITLGSSDYVPAPRVAARRNGSYDVCYSKFVGAIRKIYVENSSDFGNPMLLSVQDVYDNRYPAIAIAQQYPATPIFDNPAERYASYNDFSANQIFEQRRLVVWLQDLSDQSVAARGRFNGIYTATTYEWNTAEPCVGIPSASEVIAGELDGTLSETESGYVFIDDVTIPADSTVVFSAGVPIQCADSVTITVEGTLIIGSIGDPQVTITKTTTGNSWEGFVVEGGGTLVLNNCLLSDAVCAIECDGGSVEVDGCEFENNNTAVSVASTDDDVTIANSDFNGNMTSINLNPDVYNMVNPIPLTVSDCEFTQSVGVVFVNQGSPAHFSGNSISYSCNSQEDAAIALHSCEDGDEVIIDLCTITGNENGYGIAMDDCDNYVVISNTSISGFFNGINLLYSSPQLLNDNIFYNMEHGISWSFDHDNPPYGYVNECIIYDNGLGFTGSFGFYGYSCSPVFTCNQFLDNMNSSSAAKAAGNGAPSFYDPNQSLGANVFNGMEDEPIIVIDNNASPVFAGGGNQFTLNSSTYFISDVSNTFRIYSVVENAFDPDTSIGYFYPTNAKYWIRDDGTTSGSCKEQMMSLPGGDYGALLQGDNYALLNQTQLAENSYSTAVALSGDSTGAGAAALSRLSKLNPVLPAVGASLSVHKLFSSSYGYDARGDFSNADAKRDSILALGNSGDSLRVAYDLACSNLLRPSTMATGPQAATARERAQAKRLELLSKLSGTAKRTQVINPNSAAVPKNFALLPVYPNPFNATTKIRFDLPEAAKVRIDVFDALGRLVTTLANRDFTTGSHELQWNGSSVSSGIYFVTIHTNKYTATRKAVLLK